MNMERAVVSSWNAGCPEFMRQFHRVEVGLFCSFWCGTFCPLLPGLSSWFMLMRLLSLHEGEPLSRDCFLHIWSIFLSYWLEHGHMTAYGCKAMGQCSLASGWPCVFLWLQYWRKESRYTSRQRPFASTVFQVFAKKVLGSSWHVNVNY